jgi:bacillithiol biosynthesis cysteine-adding enzyme BshC
MKSNNIPYNQTNLLSPLIADYVSAKKEVKPFYTIEPAVKGILESIQSRNAFAIEKRQVLTSQLLAQYKPFDTEKAVLANIKLLEQANTYTITTGHQLNFATGPLYTIYKILSTINAAEALSKEQDIHVVPIFWLATEDHDFEEINHCNILGNQIKWETTAGDACGRLATEPIHAIIEEQIKPLLAKFDFGNDIIELLSKSYNHNTLGKASIHLYNKLFGKHGLVILDADSKPLKHLFAPILKHELIKQESQLAVEEQNTALNNLGYKTQAHARDINLFLLKNGIRDRITYSNNEYTLVQSGKTFTEKEILALVDESPEMFSPNVILRPVYQECILPNLAYIGGAGELAYWLQLKTVFKQFNVNFPALMLRNAAVIIQQHQADKMEKLGITLLDLFESEQELLAHWTKKHSDVEINLNGQKEAIQSTFDTILKKAEQIDPTITASISGALNAQLKAIDGLEKKLLKAEKNKNSIALNQISNLKNQLFPNNKLQERHDNVFSYVAKYGFTLIDEIKKELNPFETAFTEIKR